LTVPAIKAIVSMLINRS